MNKKNLLIVTSLFSAIFPISILYAQSSLTSLSFQENVLLLANGANGANGWFFGGKGGEGGKII